MISIVFIIDRFQVKFIKPIDYNDFDFVLNDDGKV
ncbi:hypothetical protein ZPR_4390 [Zunongwangia profunda SM-A87]|jgi:hypothetical protein|uniref:Uncharacterized protein n=1 Tax=Zunongwangia profunda (strain DSM 18752 / CCTCC AB 206139 / SM-A87) TaxID=655815 RepID=D5BC65_ZUNPS|nr:hypothetical protein ZPR_4390 [Zunongwangia profunda SM-A87]